MNVTPLMTCCWCADHYSCDHAADTKGWRRWCRSLRHRIRTAPTDRTIVVQLIDHGAGISGLEINQDEAPGKRWQGRLEDTFKTRAESHVREGDDQTCRLPTWPAVIDNRAFAETTRWADHAKIEAGG